VKAPKTLDDLLTECADLNPGDGDQIVTRIFPAMAGLPVDEAGVAAVLDALDHAGVATRELLGTQWSAFAAAYNAGTAADAPREGAAERLLTAADKHGVEPIFDKTGGLYLVFKAEVDGLMVRHVLPAQSSRAKAFLANLLFREEGQIPGGEAIGKALAIFAARAHGTGKTYELHTRTAKTSKAIWIDQSNPRWEAVRVDENGWEVVAEPKVYFKRFAHQQPQVRPAKGAGVEGFRKILEFISVTEPDALILILVYIVAALIPGIQHPILMFFGAQGAGKTFITQVIKKLVDPSDLDTLAPPNSVAETVQQLSHHWCVGYDNMSTLKSDVSDAFCRAVTGAGSSKRVLFTDDDDFVYRFKRVIMLNGINFVLVKADIYDRAILIPVERLAAGQRKPAGDFWREFKAARPVILGGALDILSKAMAILPTVILPDLPRMAEFAIHGYAIAEAMGIGGEVFIGAYKRSIEAQNSVVLGASPVATAVLRLLADPAKVKPGKLGGQAWEGTAAALLKALNGIAVAHGLDVRDRDWPKSERTVRERINEVKTNLQEAGVVVSSRASNGEKLITLTLPGGPAGPDVTGT
jgi:hypothetical protein